MKYYNIIKTFSTKFKANIFIAFTKATKIQHSTYKIHKSSQVGVITVNSIIIDKLDTRKFLLHTVCFEIGCAGNFHKILTFINIVMNQNDFTIN